ncbi:MAG: hypothetical protein ACO3JG_13275 [Luteolibacter sp.]
MSTIDTLNATASILNQTPIPRSEHPWGGADVGIRGTPPKTAAADSFRSEPRWVVTPCALELSWLFERLRDAFYAEKRLDGCSKIEFFGRLANAAHRCIQQGYGDNAAALCRAVLHEALAVYDEMEAGKFGALGIAVGSEILDDHTPDDQRTGYVSMANTIEFFRNRGLEVPAV